MNRKWTNKTIDIALLNRSMVRLTDTTLIPAPSVTKIDWKCLICEYIWSTTVDSILNLKSGCPKCSGNIQYTIESLNTKFQNDNRTIRVQTLYNGHTNNERKGEFKCGECNFVWTAILSNITHKKQGCPICGKIGRYNKHTISKFKNVIGIFYIIECENEHERFIKIGITKKDVKNRYKNVDFQYKIIYSKEIQLFLYDAWILEQRILFNSNLVKYKPLIHFGGINECFNCDDKEIILNIVQEYEQCHLNL